MVRATPLRASVVFIHRAALVKCWWRLPLVQTALAVVLSVRMCTVDLTGITSWNEAIPIAIAFVSLQLDDCPDSHGFHTPCVVIGLLVSVSPIIAPHPVLLVSVVMTIACFTSANGMGVLSFKASMVVFNTDL